MKTLRTEQNDEEAISVEDLVGEGVVVSGRGQGEIEHPGTVNKKSRDSQRWDSAGSGGTMLGETSPDLSPLAQGRVPEQPWEMVLLKSRDRAEPTYYRLFSPRISTKISS